jgi:hypothetical protein
MIADHGGEKSSPDPFRVMTKRSDSQRDSDTALEELVTDLLDCADLLRQIIDFMRGFRPAVRSDPHAPPVEVLIHAFVTEMVEPLAANRGLVELETASSVIEDFTRMIVEEMRRVPGVKVNGQKPVS